MKPSQVLGIVALLLAVASIVVASSPVPLLPIAVFVLAVGLLLS